MSLPIYRPLDRPRQDIRLLEIISTEPDIVVNLQTVSLLEKPLFDALSYVWGSSGLTERITVDSTDFFVTKNLKTALCDVYHHWRQDKEDNRSVATRRLWVDAVCIDQNNAIEKGHQLPLMTGIYSGAATVFCRPVGNSDSDAAFDIITTVSGELSRTQDQGSTRGHDQDDEWMSKHLNIFQCMGSEALSVLLHWTTVTDLMNDSYWSRMWIFQEIFLAPQIVIICGSRSITYSALRTFSTWLNGVLSQPPNRPEHMSPALWSFLKEHNFSAFSLFDLIDEVRVVGSRFSEVAHNLQNDSQHPEQDNEAITRCLGIEHHCMLLSILMAHSFAATDPRDYVYGALGISRAKIEPDYSSQPDTAVQILCPSLQVLQGWAGCDRKYQTLRSQYFPGLSDLWFLSFSMGDRLSPPLESESGNLNGKGRWIPFFTSTGGIRSNYELYPTSRHARLPKYRSLFQTRNERWGLGDRDGSYCLRCPGVIIDRIENIGPNTHDATTEFCAWVTNQLVTYPSYPTGHSSIISMSRAVWNNEPPDSLFDESNKPDAWVSSLFTALWSFECCEGSISGDGDNIDQDNPLQAAFNDLFTSFGGLELFNVLKWNSRSTEGYGRPVQYGGQSHSVNLDSGKMRECLSMLRRGLRSAQRLRIGRTTKGYLGRFPKQSCEGDTVWLLNGYDRPVILRKVDDHYIFIGSAYVIEPLGTQNDVDALSRAVDVIEIH